MLLVRLRQRSFKKPLRIAPIHYKLRDHYALQGDHQVHARGAHMLHDVRPRDKTAGFLCHVVPWRSAAAECHMHMGNAARKDFDDFHCFGQRSMTIMATPTSAKPSKMHMYGIPRMHVVIGRSTELSKMKDGRTFGRALHIRRKMQVT